MTAQRRCGWHISVVTAHNGVHSNARISARQRVFS